MSYIIKHQDVKIHEDRYNLNKLTLTQKVNRYSQILKNLEDAKKKHKSDINTIKEVKKNSWMLLLRFLMNYNLEFWVCLHFL